MRLKDNANGFWIEFINRRNSPEQFLRQNLVPDVRIMRKIGEEAISSVKGGVKHRIVMKYVKGKLVYNAFSNGSYPYGIQKRTSPDGTPYEPLAEATLRSRKWKAEQGEIPTARGADYILRETSSHIMNGMKIKSSGETRKSANVTIGWEGEDEVIAELQNKGGSGNELFYNNPIATIIPPRPFIGFQQEFIDNYFSMMSQLF